MQERTMSHVERLELISLEHSDTEGKRRRANPEEEAQRKEQKCDDKIRKRKQQARLVHIHRSRASSKSTAGGAKHIERRS